MLPQQEGGTSGYKIDAQHIYIICNTSNHYILKTRKQQTVQDHKLRKQCRPVQQHF